MSDDSPPGLLHPSAVSIQRSAGLTLSALGIVFGDIGTSPLYALKECFFGAHPVAPTHANVLGVLSLVTWSLTVVVSIKYIGFVMKADNRGEGGIFALMALIPPARTPAAEKLRNFAVLFALFGAALLYGDGVITPAISVLSAVEGLEVATQTTEPFIIPLTCAILVGLFLVQRRGTSHIGRVFGPIMLLWFFTIGILGLFPIFRHPNVLRALNPIHAYRFFAENHWHGFIVLGSVVLCITGGEALYADMGHFGRRPIRAAWFALVFPALILNYLGQGAIVLEAAAPSQNPFYVLVPPALLYPMVTLATIATVIASQALISGAYSLTRQAIQLGFSPRMRVIHTSQDNEGQIFIPLVNDILMIACVALVLVFRSSGRLAGAYGIAVTGTMAITTVVFYVVATQHWGWPSWKALPLCLPFLVFDLAFFGANVLKFFEGGWFPLAVGALIFLVMTTWKSGRAELFKRRVTAQFPIEQLLAEVERNHLHRVPGTAVFLSAGSGVPTSLLHHLKHNQVLHQQVILLHLESEHTPVIPASSRVSVTELGQGFFQVIAHYGFMQTPHVPDVLRACRSASLQVKPSSTSFYLGRETILVHGRWAWRKKLFALLTRNAQSPTTYFGLPPGRVVELGMQVDL